MAAATYNITIDQGSDFALQLTLSENDSPRDLTGYSARAHLRAKKTSSATSAVFTCTIDDPATGVVNMSLSNSTTFGLAAGMYFYDLELYSTGSGNVTRLIQGTATVTQEVTR
jgi:hypothetical protein